MIPNPSDALVKFLVDEKKDEVVGVIMTYILKKFDFTLVELIILMSFGRS